MITLVEARNYRCLKDVHRPLKPFQILVGPNASGKTTFLDVIGFLRDVVTDGLDAAITDRSPNPQDLLFQQQGSDLELAVEAEIPGHVRELVEKSELDSVRYQVKIGFDQTNRQFEFKTETLMLKRLAAGGEPGQPQLFAVQQQPRESIMLSSTARSNALLLSKKPGGNDNFYSEALSAENRWVPSFKLGPRKSALGNLPADESAFPVSTWFRDQLSAGVQRFILNSREIRRPSPPTRVSGFLPDGSNLSWNVSRLRRDDPRRHTAWIRHLRTALPDLKDIRTVERPEDRHCYLTYEYENGPTIPSWLVSDGTLRLTALTLPAYLPDLQGTYLIEEPENGIHPGAVVSVYDSLSSMYGAQVLLATHSPVMLSAADAEQLLCFTRNNEGGTDIVAGFEHPHLKEWKGATDLGTLLASGVLG